MAGGPGLDKTARPERVVVVDDDATVRALCAEALEEAGYRVDAFGAGEEALRALPTLAADVLVVDWNLPGLDGVEVARRARALAPALGVVVISGNHWAAAAAAERAGVRHVLGKPFLLEDLVAAVAAAPGAAS